MSSYRHVPVSVHRHVPVSVGSPFDQTQSYNEGPNGKIEGDEWPVEIVEMDQDGKNKKTVKVGTWRINRYEPTKVDTQEKSKGGVIMDMDFTPTEALRTHAYRFNDEADTDKFKYGMVGFLQACSATRQKKGLDDNGEPHPVLSLFTGQGTDGAAASQSRVTSDHWWIDAAGNTNSMYGISDQFRNTRMNQNERNIQTIDRESRFLTTGNEDSGKYGYYLTDDKLKELQEDSKARKAKFDGTWKPETIEKVKKAELYDGPTRDLWVNEIRQHKFETALILMSNHEKKAGMVLGVLTWGYYMDGKDVQALPVKFKKNSVSDTFQKACLVWNGKPIPNIHPAGIAQKHNGAQLNSFRLNNSYIRRSSPTHKKKSRSSPTHKNRMNKRRSQEPIYWC